MENNDVRNNPAIGHTWEEVRAELFAPEEIAESDARVAAIGLTLAVVPIDDKSV